MVRSDTQVHSVETKSTCGGGSVLHPMIKSRNSKGFVFAALELTLACMLVSWQGWIERGKRPTDWKQIPGKDIFQAGVRQGPAAAGPVPPFPSPDARLAGARHFFLASLQGPDGRGGSFCHACLPEQALNFKYGRQTTGPWPCQLIPLALESHLRGIVCFPGEPLC